MAPETISYRSGIRDRHEELLPEFQRLLVAEARPTSWCLDIGCGKGRVAFELAPMVRWVVGIDRLADRIAEAKQRAQREGASNASFLVADAESINYEDLAPTGNFQIIASNLCLTNKIIELVPQALANDGRFIVTCFETRNWEETGTECDNAYNIRDLKDALRAAGLETNEMTVVSSKIEFKSISELRDEFLTKRLLDKWMAENRWAGIEAGFARGNHTLTSSKIVFCAHKKQSLC